MPAPPVPSASPDLSAAFAPSERSRIPAFEVMRITDEIARRRADGHDVVSLCAGEPSARPAPGTLKPAGYTGPLGTAPLREAIAGHYREWYGIEVDPVIGMSADPVETLTKFSVEECQNKFAVASAGPGIIKGFDVAMPLRAGMTNRTSYVIAPTGRIVYVHSALSYKEHVQNTLAAVKSMQAK